MSHPYVDWLTEGLSVPHTFQDCRSIFPPKPPVPPVPKPKPKPKPEPQTHLITNESVVILHFPMWFLKLYCLEYDQSCQQVR